jgi:hypothetical protein
MADQIKTPHIPAAPDTKEGRRTEHPGALDNAARLEAKLKALEAQRRIDSEVIPSRKVKIRQTVGEVRRLDEQEAVAHTRRRVAEAQVTTIERHVGVHGAHFRWRTTGEMALLGAMALGETMLAYPGFKEAVPSSTGGSTDPLLAFLIGHGALFAAVAVGAGSAWLQRRIGGELAHALRSVLREHRHPTGASSADLIGDARGATV